MWTTKQIASSCFSDAQHSGLDGCGGDKQASLDRIPWREQFHGHVVRDEWYDLSWCLVNSEVNMDFCFLLAQIHVYKSLVHDYSI